MPGDPRVFAVIVTYNRRELLLESLAAVAAQTRAPDAVIVIDNASADGSAAAVRAGLPAAWRWPWPARPTLSGSWTMTRCPSRRRWRSC